MIKKMIEFSGRHLCVMVYIFMYLNILNMSSLPNLLKLYSRKYSSYMLLMNLDFHKSLSASGKTEKTELS